MLFWLVTSMFATQVVSTPLPQMNPIEVKGGTQLLRETILPNTLPPPVWEIGQNPEEYSCNPPVLSRLQRHRIKPGETIPTIAQEYNLLPETIIRLNPSLEKDSLPVGTEILIPPFNGIRFEVPAGATWKDLEAAYGVRADVLFELNGCAKVPDVVFIPGVSWSPKESRVDNYTGLSGYPLPAIAQIGLSYGWQNSSTGSQKLFHSGIDLLANPGTPVLAAEGGRVAFVGNEGQYGNLIIIDHGQGRQTRYAHLSRVQVSINQQVNSGDVIGAVGSSGRPDLPQPHLHFEVRYQLSVGWVAQDPEIHLKVKSPRN
jgi:murein DD-endopeptidase MepM/ murein hydrolase activator NlpD